jgi:uncharacterized membrane protein
MLFILSNIAISETYYGELDIRVDERGLVNIEGETNLPSIETKNSPDYTSKEGRYWVLNISTQEEFSALLYRIHLPKNTDINYLKLQRMGRIEHRTDEIVIIGTAQDQPLKILIQYSLSSYTSKASYFWIILIPAIALGVFFLLKKNKSKTRKGPIPAIHLPERQKDIYLVIKKKGQITQKELQEVTGLPKSSLSRNINSLIQKGIITKIENGMTNIIKLKE